MARCAANTVAQAEQRLFQILPVCFLASSACLVCSARACSPGMAAGSLVMCSLSCSGVSYLWGAPSMIRGPVLVAGFLQRNQAESHFLLLFIAYF